MRLKRKKNLSILIYPISILFLYFLISFDLKNVNLENSNSIFVNQLLQDSNSHLVYEKQDSDLFSNFLGFVNNAEINNPPTIINKIFAYNEMKEVEVQDFYYMQNEVVDNPRVYIYNTHPNERYVGDKIAGYDIEPGVVLATILLQEKLNEKGIATIIEEKSVSTYLKEHNLPYEDSYIASREFLTDKLKEYNDFDLIIDLHRDSLSKEKSTTIIDGKSYAKTMFVVRQGYPNIEVVNDLNNIIKKNYPSLSRGLYKKYVDTFNQDLNGKVVLLELGANYNTMDEVINSIDAMANTIEEYLK